MRLTKYQRADVVGKLIRHRFAKEAKEIIRINSVFADMLYCDAFAAADRKRMMTLPIGWLAESDHISVSFGAGHTCEQFNFNGYVYALRKVGFVDDNTLKPVKKRFPHIKERSVIKTYIPKDLIFMEWKSVNAKTQEFAKVVAESNTVADRTIETLGTFARIKKEWPEVAKFLPVEAGPIANLPAIPTAQLNERFNLP